MPTFVPRSEPVKKEEELSKRGKDLRYAIDKNYPVVKIIATAEKYRKAQLSLLKAKIHTHRDKEFKNRMSASGIERIEKEVELWRNKTVEEIIIEFKSIVR